LFPFLPSQPVNISGRFPAEYPNGAVPQLSVNGKSYKAFDYGTQDLAFSVRTADLDALNTEAIAWKIGELTIPWNKPRFDSTSPVGYENFVVLGMLPHAFGRATIEHRTDTVRREEKARVSDDFLLDTNPGGMAESRCLALSPQELADGWRVKAGSGTLVSRARTEGESGIDWQDLGLQSENELSVCWRVRASHRADNYAAVSGAVSSAEMAWSISAVIWRAVNESRVDSEEMDLAWGQRRAFAYAAGTWKLRYSKFDGSPAEVAAADVSNPLVRVNSDGTSVTISTYPF
jgi:hypothetical protein